MLFEDSCQEINTLLVKGAHQTAGHICALLSNTLHSSTTDYSTVHQPKCYPRPHSTAHARTDLYKHTTTIQLCCCPPPALPSTTQGASVCASVIHHNKAAINAPANATALPLVLPLSIPTTLSSRLLSRLHGLTRMDTWVPSGSCVVDIRHVAHNLAGKPLMSQCCRPAADGLQNCTGSWYCALEVHAAVLSAESATGR